MWVSWFGYGGTMLRGPPRAGAEPTKILAAPAARVGRVANKDLARACGDEAVEQLLREPSIDLRGGSRCLQPSVAAWVVDVDVESVLMGDVLIHDNADA